MGLGQSLGTLRFANALEVCIDFWLKQWIINISISRPSDRASGRGVILVITYPQTDPLKNLINQTHWYSKRSSSARPSLTPIQLHIHTQVLFSAWSEPVLWEMKKKINISRISEVKTDYFPLILRHNLNQSKSQSTRCINTEEHKLKALSVQ